MTLYGIEINIILFLTLISMFFISISLVFAVNNHRMQYRKSIEEFEKKIDQLSASINTLMEENVYYRNENQKTSQRIQDLEDEYFRKYSESAKIMEEQCTIELEKQKTQNQKAMEEFSKSKDMWDYFAKLFSEKLIAGGAWKK